MIEPNDMNYNTNKIIVGLDEYLNKVENRVLSDEDNRSETMKRLFAKSHSVWIDNDSGHNNGWIKVIPSWLISDCTRPNFANLKKKIVQWLKDNNLNDQTGVKTYIKPKGGYILIEAYGEV